MSRPSTAGALAVEQRDAARALHEPIPSMMPPTCATCMQEGGDAEDGVYGDPPVSVPWPCPTAWALGADDARPYTHPWGTT